MTTIKIDFTYHRVLLRTAEAQLDEHQHPIAIVTAQMAVEVRIDEALRKLLGTYPELPTEALMNVLPDRTMMQRLYEGVMESADGGLDQGRSGLEGVPPARGTSQPPCPRWGTVVQVRQRRGKPRSGSGNDFAPR